MSVGDWLLKVDVVTDAALGEAAARLETVAEDVVVAADARLLELVNLAEAVVTLDGIRNVRLERQSTGGSRESTVGKLGDLIARAARA